MKAVKINNNQIKLYKTLPNTWGGCLGGFKDLSDSDLQTHGFYDVVVPEINHKIQKLGAIAWDSDNEVYTYPVVSLTWSKTLAQLKLDRVEEINISAQTEMKKTDWFVTKKAELGTAIPDDILIQRINLRAQHKLRLSEVKALTSKSAVMNYENDLEDFNNLFYDGK